MHQKHREQLTPHLAVCRPSGARRGVHILPPQPGRVGYVMSSLRDFRQRAIGTLRPARCACVSSELRLEWKIEIVIDGFAISHYFTLSSRASAWQRARSGDPPETGMA